MHLEPLLMSSGMISCTKLLFLCPQRLFRMLTYLPALHSYNPYRFGPLPRLIESIRASQDEPTLDTIPRINPGFQDAPQPCQHLIMQMQRTRVHRWGFVIFRCAYADQAQWETYLHYTKLVVRNSLENKELDGLLWKYLEWTVIEDPNLNGASKQAVREWFTDWVADCQESNGHPIAEDMARFNFCLYIDQKCLDSMDKFDINAMQGRSMLHRIVSCVILDKNCSWRGKGRKGFPNVEGCLRHNTGWMYADLPFLVTLYDKLCREGLADFEMEWARPPLIFPSNRPSLAMPE